MAEENNKSAFNISLIKPDLFWLEDPSILYKNNNYTKIIPTLVMTRYEQLNSLTRFFIALLFLFIFFEITRQLLIIPIICLFFIIALYYINKMDSNRQTKELNRILNLRDQESNMNQEEIKKELRHDTYDGINREEIVLEEFNNTPKNNIQAGFIDSNGDIIIYDNPDKYKNNNIDIYKNYTIDEIMDYQKNTAIKPTTSNPFMNTDITKYNNGDIPCASNVDDEDIKQDMVVNFNADLFRDIDELFDKKNSQRQFYTTPNTLIPNNQTEFANWLYKIPDTCKAEQKNCLRYDPLRFHTTTI
jgi:hypothetical protein